LKDLKETESSKAKPDLDPMRLPDSSFAPDFGSEAERRSSEPMRPSVASLVEMRWVLKSKGAIPDSVNMSDS
jgi:hypothetical protein